MGSCLQALMRRKPFPASNIPVAVQRRVILASRQCFTSRQTCRMLLFMDAMLPYLATVAVIVIISSNKARAALAVPGSHNKTFHPPG